MQKRFITAFILLILVGVTSSCNKDDNKDNLVGTIWIGNFEDYKETIAFTSNTLCTLTEVNNNEDYRVTYQCSYTYNQPNITIKMESETLTQLAVFSP